MPGGRAPERKMRAWDLEDGEQTTPGPSLGAAGRTRAVGEHPTSSQRGGA